MISDNLTRLRKYDEFLRERVFPVAGAQRRDEALDEFYAMLASDLAQEEADLRNYEADFAPAQTDKDGTPYYTREQFSNGGVVTIW